MAEVVIEKCGEESVEIVEAKGKGHPDTLCDTLCEKASNALSRFYLKNFGKVLHHNIDKGLIIAGAAKPKFLGGEIISPFKIIIAGRATAQFGNVKIPVSKIISETVQNYMKSIGISSFEVVVDVKEGAANLKEVFSKIVSVANDTSIGAAHYPYSETEKAVLKAADVLGSEKFRKRFVAAGWDFKIMGLRHNKQISLNIALAFIGRHVKDMDHYKKLKMLIRDYLKKETGAEEVSLNMLDSYKDESSVYLTVTGLSAEMGDDGQVGRGNRFNGLITPGKPMSLEAVSGKNIFHPGKLYQIMAHIIAKSIFEKCKVEEVRVKLLTHIGRPLREPQIVHIQIKGKYDSAIVKDVVEQNFKNLGEIQKNIIEEKFS